MIMITKFFMMAGLFVCLTSGCARQEPKTPVIIVVKEEKDNFDVAGGIVASGSRMVWNAAKGAYEWTTSEENKKRAEEAWEWSKKNVKEGLEKAKEKLEDKSKLLVTEL